MSFRNAMMPIGAIVVGSISGFLFFKPIVIEELAKSGTLRKDVALPEEFKYLREKTEDLTSASSPAVNATSTKEDGFVPESKSTSSSSSEPSTSY
ncbi:hypothetical protein NADFUDRAFT_51455 [Nadsonia fulvescens var. elongata DSM 6958]|uniref:Uncharacterized protein n=1 Tax=Nadsonia fulvescens var. elongata DSM 6958 TaxID=857566 RepID=A0A1E3PHG4_9ASCO|nr:hypothetical protein NADFUDRAFT_51455 [Nadsonia fulvescens var. elongata DSM 6958]